MDAANPRVVATVGDQQIPLVCDIDAMIRYRDEVGRALEDDFQELLNITVRAMKVQEAAKNGTLAEAPKEIGLTRSLEIFASLLWAVMLDAQPEATPHQVRKLIPPPNGAGYVDLMRAVTETVSKGLGFNAPRPTPAVTPISAKPRKPKSTKLNGTVSGNSPADVFDTVPPNSAS